MPYIRILNARLILACRYPQRSYISIQLDTGCMSYSQACVKFIIKLLLTQLLKTIFSTFWSRIRAELTKYIA